MHLLYCGTKKVLWFALFKPNHTGVSIWVFSRIHCENRFTNTISVCHLVHTTSGCRGLTRVLMLHWMHTLQLTSRNSLPKYRKYIAPMRCADYIQCQQLPVAIVCF